LPVLTAGSAACSLQAPVDCSPVPCHARQPIVVTASARSPGIGCRCTIHYILSFWQVILSTYSFNL